MVKILGVIVYLKSIFVMMVKLPRRGNTMLNRGWSERSERNLR